MSDHDRFGPSGRGRWRWLLAALLAMAMVAAACNGDDDDAIATDPGVTDQDDPVDPADPADPAPAPGDVEAGGTLRYAYALSPSRFDAHRSTIGQDIRLLAPVYDRLVHYDETGEFMPGLAESWEFSDDGLELSFQLREGVVFHDGAPFNAEAVAANIERGQTVEGTAVATDLVNITEVRIDGEYEVTFLLDEANSILPGLMSSRAGMMVSPTAFDNDDLDFAPVGAGPYRVVEYRLDDMIVYEKFEDYWDEDIAGPDRVEVRVLADTTTRLNALLTGEVDVALLLGNQIEEAERAGLNIDARPTTAYTVLYLNRAESEFDNQLVRQALNHAIDRQAYTNVVLGGAGENAVQPFSSEYFAYNDDYPWDHYEYDPDRARELLAEAGLPDGFTFEMLVPSLEVYIQGAEVAQAMLAEVGIQTTLRQVEAAQTADIYYAQQDGDSLLAQWGGRPDPQITMNLQFSAEGFSNPGRHTTPRFIELNDAAKAAIDPDERNDLMQDMVAEIVEQAFQVPLAHDYMVHGYTDAVQGFSLLPQGELFFRRMGVSQ
jgi:peptide/nickel transport system substrate-binding protein